MLLVPMLIPLLALSAPAEAQDLAWAGLGAHAGMWQHRGHDTVTLRYNDTRPWLEAPLRPHRLQAGPVVRLGFVEGPLYLELGGSLHYGRVSVQSTTAAGASGRREWRQGRMSTDAGIGYAWRGGHSLFAVAAMASIGIGTHRSRAWVDEDPTPPLRLAHVQLFLGIGLAAPWTIQPGDGPVGITLRPAVSYQLTPSNGRALNRALNTDTAHLDPRPSLRGHGVVAGIELLLAFARLRSLR